MIRMDFVSNSSSSSFVINKWEPGNLTKQDVFGALILKCDMLNLKYAKMTNQRNKKLPIKEISKDIYDSHKLLDYFMNDSYTTIDNPSFLTNDKDKFIWITSDGWLVYIEFKENC